MPTRSDAEGGGGRRNKERKYIATRETPNSQRKSTREGVDGEIQSQNPHFVEWAK
jgi:hypothetical protein